MSVTVKDMAGLMDHLAPPVLAEDWDNCGLQVGSFDAPVRSVWVALDPSREVVTAACEAGVDLLITHHPLFISPLSRVDTARMPGQAIAMAIQHGLSIFSAHTNLDSAAGGVNDICAERLGLLDCRVLAPSAGAAYFKLAFFVPESHEQTLLDVLAGTRAGTVGKYSCCSFASRGTGRFKPSEAADPFIGSAGEISRVEEVRIETVVEQSDLGTVVRLLKDHHPYETMAYDIFPLSGSIAPRQGLGRIGSLAEPMTLGELAREAKKAFGVDQVRVAGDVDTPVKQVAVCSGSGSGLMTAFLASGADVYVSGDLKYHDGVDAGAAGRGLIDVGHFGTEIPVVAVLVEKLTALAATADLPIKITEYTSERAPYVMI